MIIINCTPESIEWYNKFNIHQKINLKEYSILICGLDWTEFNILFTPRERIQILFEKVGDWIKN